MNHACYGCVFFYIGKVHKSKDVYNALSESFTTISVIEEGPCCGIAPGGEGLDVDQPICKDFKSDV